MPSEKIPLSKPLTFNGEVWTEVTVRPPLLADMLAADDVKGEQTKQAAIYASICGIPMAAFRGLDADDYLKIVQETDALVGKTSAPAPQVTGAESQG